MDRNRIKLLTLSISAASLSARRAWIEIWASGLHGTGAGVALRKESVDRNSMPSWNTSGMTRVALRKESVDRNFHQAGNIVNAAMSLSARRAWIEMPVIGEALH